MSFRLMPTSSMIRGFAAPAAAIVAGGLLIGFALLSRGELKAAPIDNPRDSDGDGLSNLQEKVLGTNRFQADTDGDGFSDLEELARHSSPLFSNSIPEGQRMRVGLTCRGGDTELHALIAIYLPDGDVRGKTFKAGLVVGNRCVTLSQSYLEHHADFALRGAQDPGAQIVTIDLPITPRYVRAFGHMSVFATVGDQSLGVVQAADSIHLSAFGPVIVLQVPQSSVVGMSNLTGSGQQTGGSTGGSVGSIYVPLPVGGEPSGWIAGQVCVQQTVVIGVSGPQIMQEIVTADCQDGYDGYCPTNCSATVGNTYTTVDPVALIGG